MLVMQAQVRNKDNKQQGKAGEANQKERSCPFGVVREFKPEDLNVDE